MKQLISLATLLLFTGTTCSWADVKPGKTYIIAPKADTGKAVFVTNSELKENTAAVVWTETGSPAQQWTVEDNGDGTFALRNVYTGKYLARNATAISSTTTFVEKYNKDNIQCKWTFDPVDGGADEYRLVQTQRNKGFVATANATADGSAIGLQSADAEGGDKTTWVFTETTPLSTFNAATRNRMVEAFLNRFLVPLGSNSTFTHGGWGEAEVLETMLDAYEVAKDERCLNAFKSVYKTFAGQVGSNWLKLVYKDEYKWYGHDFNDDVMWMIIAMARAYHLTGNRLYLSLAKTNFDAIYKRAFNQWGMMRWAEQTGNKNGTNSCINGPTEVAACYIALATGDESYFEIARDLYAKQRQYLYNAETGEVYDSFTWNADTNQPEGYNHWVSTYNQGTMLGAATMLYSHYGDQQYRDDADKIVDCTKSKLCNASGIVNVCQTPEGDLCGFKGILMRYLRQYATTFGKSDINDLIAKNALHAFSNANSEGIASSAWLTKSAEDGTFGDKKYIDQPFGCSTAVSAAVNCVLPGDAPTAIAKTAGAAASDRLSVVFNPPYDRLEVTAGCDSSIVVANTVGQVMASAKTCDGAVSINTSGWPKGVYAVRASENGPAKSAKVIKK